ncbi:hypothetical protein METH_22800 (plasmid) [Leisingera methylohalidivorans DSM 14336]|uniref:Transposase n=1 Tax=Leisingera methylohalidivorans DSM 14336 TaxID=999552 RepID=V9W3D2_9RHOB|nr:hypothetical protein METH_22800 [Leisingera methylohalidivorans DSM 14336]
MGWVMMSERELNRVEILAQVDDGRLTVDNAANLLDLTRRQVFRLLKRYRQDGAVAIRHKARGKPPNNRIHRAKREYALSLIKENYPDFRPTLAAEMLAEHHGFKVSRETLRKCPLVHSADALPGGRWPRTVFGFRASSGASSISRACAGNALAS